MSNPNAISIEVGSVSTSASKQPSNRKAARAAAKSGRGGRPAPFVPPVVAETDDSGNAIIPPTGEKKKKKFFHRKEKDDFVPVEKELGVSKIKAALRQAKRFLNKDGLAADVRTETERRVKSLEADLEKALSRNEEKKNASKYHMVKFFERQKLLKRIKPLQRTLATSPPDDAQALAALESSIHEMRVGLNYVLNYPNSQKYISLFPPSSRSTAGEENEDGDEVPDDGKVMPILRKSKPGADETDRRRSELVENVRKLMTEGRLSATPEIELETGDRGAKRKRGPLDGGASSSKKGRPDEEEEAGGLEGDDFFGGDDSD